MAAVGCFFRSGRDARKVKEKLPSSRYILEIHAFTVASKLLVRFRLYDQKCSLVGAGMLVATTMLLFFLRCRYTVQGANESIRVAASYTNSWDPRWEQCSSFRVVAKGCDHLGIG